MSSLTTSASRPHPASYPYSAPNPSASDLFLGPRVSMEICPCHFLHKLLSPAQTLITQLKVWQSESGNPPTGLFDRFVRLVVFGAIFELRAVVQEDQLHLTHRTVSLF